MKVRELLKLLNNVNKDKDVIIIITPEDVEKINNDFNEITKLHPEPCLSYDLEYNDIPDDEKDAKLYIS